MKKGISLIVLVITIIVIIILSGAVILSLSNNNPINQASNAVFLSDIKTIQSSVSLYLAKEYTNNTDRPIGTFDPNLLVATATTAKYNNLPISGVNNITDIILPLKDKPSTEVAKYEIQAGKLVYVGTNTVEQNLVVSAGVNTGSKTSTANYGTSVQNPYTNIYTKSNGLITTSPVSVNYGNYDKTYGAISLFGASTNLYTAQTPNDFAYVYAGTNTYNLTRNTNTNRWISVYFRAGGLTTNVWLSNFRLIFTDNSSYTLTEAITAGYVEPLVLAGSGGGNSTYTWPSIYNLVSGSSTETRSYPEGYLLFKVKNMPVKAFSIYSSTAFSTGYDGYRVIEANSDATDYSISTF